MNRTQYQEEYCGMKGGRGSGSGGGGSGGGGSAGVAKLKSEIEQPVGGRVQAAYRAQAISMKSGVPSGDGVPPPPMPAHNMAVPVYDEDYVATVYNESERGTHRIQPHWRSVRDVTRADTATLYEPADRDPCKRKNFSHIYKTTAIDAPNTPYVPLSVPDVHKFRYMHGTYMTGDDWY